MEDAPPLRAAPFGVRPFLADVESRLPPEMGTRYRDKSRVTWCHETTHGVHAALRNTLPPACLLSRRRQFAQVEPPAVTLAEVAAAVPPRLRGTRFEIYLVRSGATGTANPLYVWDEWVAYNNGTTTGIEEARRSAGKCRTMPCPASSYPATPWPWRRPLAARGCRSASSSASSWPGSCAGRSGCMPRR